MSEFTLPANSKVGEGKHWALAKPAKHVKSFRIYRWDPAKNANPTMDTFDIDRFADKGSRHRFQYLPFGAGGRTCVGAQFATAEALTILAHWLSQWRFVDAGHPVRAAGMVTLRPAGGLPLRLERR